VADVDLGDGSAVDAVEVMAITMVKYTLW